MACKKPPVYMVHPITPSIRYTHMSTNQHILAIDTSCDETSVAITHERRVIAHVEYSQVTAHQEWGGVVPSVAKRAHEERIQWVIDQAIRRYDKTCTRDTFFANHINAIAVTYGPGLAIALEVGIRTAKQLAHTYHKRLIAVNHMAGHVYSCFVQNSNGNPPRDYTFPSLVLLISGGHTEIDIMHDHGTYTKLGETRDDAAGEALDKAARLIGLGYPGGAAMEALARQVNNADYYRFPRPMRSHDSLDLSFSGLKTKFLYTIQAMGDKEKNQSLNHLASSYQEAVFDSVVTKIRTAIKQTGITTLIVGGGVSANIRLRTKLRTLMRKQQGTVLFPPYPYLTGDNAAMIGVAAHYQAQRNGYVDDVGSLDRVARLSLAHS